VATRNFASPAVFAAFLANASGRTLHNMRDKLEEAARLVEKDAKGQIGHYQPAVSIFAEWNILADRTIQDKIRLGYAPPDNPLLREGHLRDSIEHQVSVGPNRGEAAVYSNSTIAVYQELGTADIPSRPFLGPALAKNTDRVVDLLGRGAAGAYMDLGFSGGRLL
jgi:hypothetical protein